MSATAQLPTRRATEQDEPQILALMRSSLGWLDDEHYVAFFRWKHRENPFGASPGWVCMDGDTVVGFRTFMRWEFVDGGRVLKAVRAVDTATHPDYRGKGIFSRLTAAALEDLQAEGMDFVFNTPNDQSLPGYLKLGWQIVGQPAVGFRPRSVTVLPTMAKARTPAELGSVPTTAGLPAADVLSDHDAVGDLLAAMPPGTGMRTNRTLEYLSWRYGLDSLAYRVLPLKGDIERGVVVFRLRRRGPATELVVTDVLVPRDEGRALGAALHRLVKVAGADYAMGLTGSTDPRLPLLPLPRMGPILTTRPLAGQGPEDLSGWRLSMGDVELF